MKKTIITLFFLLLSTNSFSNITYSIKEINESYACQKPLLSNLKLKIYKFYINRFVTYTITSYGKEKGLYLGHDMGDTIYGFNRNGKDFYFDTIEKDSKNSRIKFTRSWFSSDEIGSIDEGNKSVLREKLEFVKNYELPEGLFKNEARIFLLNKDYLNKLFSDRNKALETQVDSNETICIKK